MVLRTTYNTKLSVEVSIIYDDNSVKKYNIAIEDIVKISYMKDGYRRDVEGRVADIRIEDGHAGHIGHIASCECCINQGCYIIVDSSTNGSSGLDKIDVDTIIAIEIMRKASESSNVTSPIGDYNVKELRIVGNQLQLTLNGAKWLAVTTLPNLDPVVDPEYQSLADKIAALIPDCARPDHKQEAVEGLVELFKEQIKNDDPSKQ